MTRFIKPLDSEKSYTNNHVTLGNGEKGKIIGSGNLIDNGLPNLNNVLLVKGLTFNLISITQLCDQGMTVNFSKCQCIVTDEKEEVLMRGIKTKNNCYTWVPQIENFNGGSTKMFPTMLKHLDILKGVHSLHSDKANIKNYVTGSREKLTSDTSARILGAKHLGNSKGKLDFFVNENLKLLLKVRCTKIILASLLPLAHTNSGNSFQIITQLSSKSNHTTLNPNHDLFPSELPTIIHTSVTKYQNPSFSDELYQRLHINMKFKTDISVTEERNTIDTISSITPSKYKKMTLAKSALKKKMLEQRVFHKLYHLKF